MGHIGAFRRAAVKDIESAAGDDRAVIELAGIDVPRFVRQDDAAGDDGIRRLAADREGQVARKERKRVRHAGDLDRSPERENAEHFVRSVHHRDRAVERIRTLGKQVDARRLVRIDRQRIGRRALDHRKPGHKRRCARGRSGQVKFEHSPFIHRDDGIACKPHLACCRAAAGNEQEAIVVDCNIFHFGAGGDKCIAVDRNIVCRAAIEDGESAVIADLGAVHFAAAVNIDEAIPIHRRDVVRHAAVINIKPAVADLRTVHGRPGVDRGGRIGKDQTADRIRCERCACAVLKPHIAAVFHDIQSRAAAVDTEDAAVHDIAGDERVLHLERDSAGRPLDIGVGSHIETNVRALVSHDIGRRAAAGNSETAAGTDSNIVRRTAVGDKELP